MKTNQYYSLHLHQSLALEVDPTILDGLCRLGVPIAQYIFLFVNKYEFGYVWIYVDAEH